MASYGSNKPLRVTGLKGLVANLHRAKKGTQQQIRKVNLRMARQTRDLARQLAPMDTGNLRESITYEISEGGLVFHVFHDPAFYPDGVNYGILQEFGFRHPISGEFIQNPHLLPAADAMAGTYSAEISRAVRRAMNQMGK